MTPTVLVVGGGTAGWMAACLMARAWPAATITLVESSAIPTIGVGEGSTPQLRGFFEGLGVAEAEWMPACDATYKAGIAFHAWSREPGFEQYIHPFASAVDLHTQPAFSAAARLRRTGHATPAHPDGAVSLIRKRLSWAELRPEAHVVSLRGSATPPGRLSVVPCRSGGRRGGVRG